MAKIGLIGLGNMGLPMSANLVKAGHDVRGFDIVKDNITRAAAGGVKPCASAADAARDVDAVITMLPAGAHVLAVYREMLPACAPNTLVIDCSTIDVASARTAHDMASAAGLPSLDAPVSGGVGGATAGTLTFMVGGGANAFGRAQAYFEAMGKKSVLCGEAGAGQSVKICNNMMLAVAMIGVAEGFVLAEKLGLSHQALFDVASTATAQSWALTSYCPVPGPVPASPANNDYKAGFASALMLKDLKLAQEAAAASGATTPMGAAAAQLYAMHNAWGEGGADFSAIIRLIRGKTG